MNSISRALIRVHSYLRPRFMAVTAAVSVLLAGFGAAAIAVAPAVNSQRVPVTRFIAHDVQSEGLSSQLEALAGHPMVLVRSTQTRPGDNASSLLQRLGLADAETLAFLQTDPSAAKLLVGRAGRHVHARATDSGELIELITRFPSEDPAKAKTHFIRLTLARVADQWHAREEERPFTASLRMASGVITSSLFAATESARVPDEVAVQLAEVFGSDIDFHRDLRKGDRFSVLYEAMQADDEPVTWSQGAGRLVAAEFVNQGHAHQAVWLSGPGQAGGQYYDFNGRSLKRAFLASPLEFSRVTSGFAMRMHPLHKQWRAHLGVDYGAPAGTTVRAVGDGVVDHAGPMGGYGNVVQITHSHDRSTLYAHLSRVDVKLGQKVEQGESIGAVGATGWATGPHLHFEFRVKGMHEDPQRLAHAADSPVMDQQARERFATLMAQVRPQIEVAGTMAVSGRIQRE